MLNRGDAAVRFLTAARDWRQARERELRTVLFHTDEDGGSLAAGMADATVQIPDSVLGGYTDPDALLTRLDSAEIEAVWLGWGFLSESADFVEALSRQGHVVLAPPPAAIRQVGDKIRARALAVSTGVPVLEGSSTALGGIDDALAEAQRVGYPVMLKWSGGGGGRGIQLVDSEAQLGEAFARVSRQAGAGANFFVERRAAGARHIEVQFAADARGGSCVLGLRDCSIQRHRQKIVEETAILDPPVSEALSGYTERLATAVGYVGVGTVEFLVTGNDSYFLEINPRLQVEHAVTELTTGLDLVKLQLEIASGNRVPQNVTNRGHAIEVRLNAEDPQNDFIPTPGRILIWRHPKGPGVRLDTGFELFSSVSPKYDSMVARLLTWGSDRSEAVSRMRLALDQCRLMLEGGTSNRSLLRGIVQSPDFAASRTDIDWLDRSAPQLIATDDRVRNRCLLVAALEVAIRDMTLDKRRFLLASLRGRPPQDLAGSWTVEFRCDDVTYQARVTPLSPHRMDVNGTEVETHRNPNGDRMVSTGAQNFTANVLWTESALFVESDEGSVRCDLDDAGRVRAPTSGAVVHLAVQAGDEVDAGDTIALIEAMKMETRVLAPFKGTVKGVHVAVGQPVTKDDPVVTVEGSGSVTAGCVRPLVADLADSGPPSGWAGSELVERTVNYLLGHDLPPGLDSAVLDRWSARGIESGAGPEGALAVLETVLDVLTLGRRSPRWDLWERPELQSLLLVLRFAETEWPPLPAEFEQRLRKVVRVLGYNDVGTALYWLWRSVELRTRAQKLGETILGSWSRLDVGPQPPLPRAVDLLSELALVATEEAPRLAELAHLVRHRLVVGESPSEPIGGVLPRLLRRACRGGPAVESYVERLYGRPEQSGVEDDLSWFRTSDGRLVVVSSTDEISPARLPKRPTNLPEGHAVLELLSSQLASPGTHPDLGRVPRSDLAGWDSVRLTIAVSHGGLQLRTAERTPSAGAVRPGDVHPELAERLELWRYSEFDLVRLQSTDDVVLFDATATSEPADHRMFALSTVTGMSELGPEDQRDALNDALLLVLSEMRARLASYRPGQRPTWNRVVLYIGGEWLLDDEAVRRLAHGLETAAQGLDLERVILTVRSGDALSDQVLQVASPTAGGISVGKSAPSLTPVRVLSAYGLRVARVHRRGLVDPYEIVTFLTVPSATAADFPSGTFVEYDLDDRGRLAPVDRPKGLNEAAVVVGVVENYTQAYPDGIRRVLLASDPSRRMGSLAEPECRRIIAALDLAEELSCPVEWFTVSSGAQISMESGTENMDWVARALRRIVEFTQAGHDINIVVTGVNVGAQPYFDAEATMLMHTKGILIMVAGSSMVLTGKDALDLSGGVSGRDNVEIGGYPGVMGPNGQAQFYAPTLSTAFETLFRWYELTYISRGEERPRPVGTTDALERDITRSGHPPLPGGPERDVGEIFSSSFNPDRKRPFSMRAVMQSLIDADHPPLERWAGYGDGVIVWEARLGGVSVCVTGIESHNLPRPDAPADAPDVWTAGTLFPQGAKKLARAINSASGRRPILVLANLAGFDGSPASLRSLQLEYGAEIGRAVVNCQSPILLCVLTRYHGGAFVVLSKFLNDRLTVFAVEGAKASVIGGTPAAAVVLGPEVRRRATADPQVEELERTLDSLDGEQQRADVRRALDVARQEAYQRQLSAVAAEFDAVHSIERALEVGSVDRLVSAELLRRQLATQLLEWANTGQKPTKLTQSPA